MPAHSYDRRIMFTARREENVLRSDGTTRHDTITDNSTTWLALLLLDAKICKETAVEP